MTQAVPRVGRAATSGGRAPLARPAVRPASGAGRADAVLRLQSSAGNAAVSRMLAGDAVVQRAHDFVLGGLTVAGGTAVAGAADSFVAARGATVTVTATVTSASGATLPAGVLKWSGGAAGAGLTQRVVRTGGRATIRARIGATTRSVRVHIVDAAAPPAANPAARLEHRLVGRANPGANFGLTVVTIGTQGVKGPTFTLTPHFDAGNWQFRLDRVRHGYKLGIHSLGRRNIAGPASVRPAQLPRVVTDLTPPGAGAVSGPPRTRNWSQAITQSHEEAHVTSFYTRPPFWIAAMGRFETALEAARVPYHPTTAASSRQVKASRQAGFQTTANTEHGVADAAEIGGSELFAHGVSNPMYTTLLAAITAAVRPPAPTGVTAVAVPGAVTLTWALQAAVTNGTVIERAIGRGGFSTVATLAAGVLTFTDAGLPANTPVRYRVFATGTAGRSAAAATRARTPP